MTEKNQDIMIVADGKYYSLDCHQTRCNNNTLIVGASGTGKTRGVVIPNLLQASGSYIISDPKGMLYREYGDYMRSEGYRVKYIDFIHPEKSDHYNPFSYLHSTQDITKLAEMIVGSEQGIADDPFWDNSAAILIAALIGYLKYHQPEECQNIETLISLITLGRRNEYGPFEMQLDLIMDAVRNEMPDSWAVSQYDKVRVAAERTWNSILITLSSKMRNFDTEELNQMMNSDSINIPSIGQEKTALFVVVSDSDRSMDTLVNIFFSQAMNELCTYADEQCEEYCLPVPVRFILDDFATNCSIAQFPRMISAIRSRGISTMLMIQAESQLKNTYGKDAETIISNCDTYCYLGGTDLDTARNIAERVDRPLKEVLYMPIGRMWVFRRGQNPELCRNYELLSSRRYQEAVKQKRVQEEILILQP